MIEKLINEQLEEFLLKRNQKKYTYLLNTLNNVGNPMLAVTEMEGYCIDNDFLLIISYFFNGCEVFFEISEEDHLKDIYHIVKEKLKNANEYFFSSDSKELYNNPVFVNYFGEHSAKAHEQYGYFRKDTPMPNTDNIRLVRGSDEEAVCNYKEPHCKWTNNLRNAYETNIKNSNQNTNQNYRIYGYFAENEEILGYLISNTFDNKYWDIEHIHVTEEARNRGIGGNLAKYYAYDITSQGLFASYGYAANEASVHTALSAGFERFSVSYRTPWNNISTLKNILL